MVDSGDFFDSSDELRPMKAGIYFLKSILLLTLFSSLFGYSNTDDEFSPRVGASSEPGLAEVMETEQKEPRPRLADPT